MLLVDDTMHLTATDLVGHLGCRQLTSLETAAATGAASRPHSWDPLLEILWERGARFEQEYCSHLGATGLELVRIDGIRVDDAALAQTSEAMRRGVPVILQAALASGRWRGRADVLRRVERPSNLGTWSYEALDTKLARERRPGRSCSSACIPNSSPRSRACGRSTCTSSRPGTTSSPRRTV